MRVKECDAFFNFFVSIVDVLMGHKGARGSRALVLVRVLERVKEEDDGMMDDALSLSLCLYNNNNNKIVYNLNLRAGL